MRLGLRNSQVLREVGKALPAIVAHKGQGLTLIKP